MYVIQVTKRIWGRLDSKDCISYLHLDKNQNQFYNKKWLGTLSSLKTATRFNTKEEAESSVCYLNDVYDHILSFEILEI